MVWPFNVCQWIIAAAIASWLRICGWRHVRTIHDGTTSESYWVRQKRREMDPNEIESAETRDLHESIRIVQKTLIVNDFRQPQASDYGIRLSVGKIYIYGKMIRWVYSSGSLWPKKKARDGFLVPKMDSKADIFFSEKGWATPRIRYEELAHGHRRDVDDEYEDLVVRRHLCHLIIFEGFRTACEMGLYERDDFAEKSIGLLRGACPHLEPANATREGGCRLCDGIRGIK